MWPVQQAPPQQSLLLMVQQQPDQPSHLAALQGLPPLQAAQIQPPVSQQQQQYFDQQYLLQQQLHQQPQQLTVHGQVAAQWQQQPVNVAEQPVSAAASSASAVTIAQAAVDPTASYQLQLQQQQHMIQQQLLALQQQQQLVSAAPAAAQQLVQPVAAQQPQHFAPPMPAVPPAPAAPALQWQQQHLYPQHQYQQQQQLLQPVAQTQLPPPAAAVATGPWQQQQHLYAPRAPQHQQYQPTPMVRVHTTAGAGSQQRAAAGVNPRWQDRKQAGRQQLQPDRQPQQRDRSGQQRPQQDSRSRSDLDKGQDRRQQESQTGRQMEQLPQHKQQLQQKRQQQGRSGQQRQQQDDTADDFSFHQWQLQSRPWRTQARQQRESEDQQRYDTAQLQQSEQRKQERQRPEPLSAWQARQQQQQPPDPSHTARNRKNRQKKAAKLKQQRLKKAQQDQPPPGEQEPQQQLKPQQQPVAGPPAFRIPLHRLPPRVISNISNRLKDQEQVSLAEALPQDSAAAAAAYSVIHTLQLRKGVKGMSQIRDVPGCVARMRGLKELVVRLWMDDKIQARTGLASLSNLAQLTKLEIIAEVLPKSSLMIKTTDDRDEPTPKRRKFGAFAPPPPSLTQQLSNQLSDPAVKIQEEFWQITTALGKLTNLKDLSLSAVSITHGSKNVFRHLGYQSLAPLSSLTGLVSLHVKYDVAQAGSGLACLSALTALSNLHLEETGGTDITDGEAAVMALSAFWHDATNLKRLQLRTQYLGPEVVRQMGLRHSLDVLDVSECRAFFPYFRTWGHLRRISGLQALHVSNCKGITAADVETVSSSFASSLSYLDISRNTAQPDGGDLRGSIDALGRLTNLQHLDAFNSCIAPAGDGSEGGVCSILAQLTKLTYLSVGSVMRSVMVIPADDVAHLSALTGMVKLSIAGAQLGVGLDNSTDCPTRRARLEWVRPMRHLFYIRLWACRFTHIPRHRVTALFCGRKISIVKRQIRKSNCIIFDGQWYPNRHNACHEEPAEYSGDEDDMKGGDGGGYAANNDDGAAVDNDGAAVEANAAADNIRDKDDGWHSCGES